jgi:hypothetical protein
MAGCFNVFKFFIIYWLSNTIFAFKGVLGTKFIQPLLIAYDLPPANLWPKDK